MTGFEATVTNIVRGADESSGEHDAEMDMDAGEHEHDSGDHDQDGAEHSHDDEEGGHDSP